MHKINYEDLIKNLETMINSLEYDSMRSAGKSKMNAGSLVDLYAMKDRYEAAAKKPAGRPKKSTEE